LASSADIYGNWVMQLHESSSSRSEALFLGHQKLRRRRLSWELVLNRHRLPVQLLEMDRELVQCQGRIVNNLYEIS
jgi:hypothetical protein